ncbi:MAG: GAF domain-containing sensor histidine kinase [Anaerolineae bacterium]|nr:GAF domain-containing sensor histidine kinase [Anaerolineae bacterium]
MVRTIAIVFAGAAFFVAGVVTGTANDTRMAVAGLGLVVIATLLVIIVRDRVVKAVPRTASIVSETKTSARAVYEMATALGETLDYQRVMQVALDLGFLGLKDVTSTSQDSLVGMVMLFRNEELRVVSSRGLTRQDAFVKLHANSGVLALALNRAEPMLTDDARNDPELSYFVGLQPARSVLVIPLRAEYQTYGMLVYASLYPDAFDREHIEMLAAIATQATMALQNAMLYENLRREKERLVEVEEEARKKLARDLHDGPTQTISAVVMRVGIVMRNLTENKGTAKQSAEELAKVEELARRATKEMRHMLFTLRPLVLESQGLTAALNQLSVKMKDTHGTNVIVETQPDAEAMISESQQGMLFYIMEEAANNARKYSQAPKITLRLFKENQYAVAEVEDNGVGFDVSAVMNKYDERGSLGMINMRERAQAIGGKLSIDSRIGYGTRITVVMVGKGRTGALNPAVVNGNAPNNTNGNGGGSPRPSTMRRPNPSTAPSHMQIR